MFVPPSADEFQDPGAHRFCTKQLLNLEMAFCYDLERDPEGEPAQRLVVINECRQQHKIVQEQRDATASIRGKAVEPWFNDWLNRYESEYLGKIHDNFPQYWKELSGKAFDRASLRERARRQHMTELLRNKTELHQNAEVRLLNTADGKIGQLKSHNEQAQAWLVKLADGETVDVEELALRLSSVAEEDIDEVKSLHPAKDTIPKFELPEHVDFPSKLQSICDEFESREQAFETVYHADIRKLEDFRNEVSLRVRNYDSSTFEELRDERHIEQEAIDSMLREIQRTDAEATQEYIYRAVYGQEPTAGQDLTHVLNKKRTILLWEREALSSETASLFQSQAEGNLGIQKLSELERLSAIGGNYTQYAEDIASLPEKATSAVREGEERLQLVQTTKEQCFEKQSELSTALENQSQKLRDLWAELLKESDKFDNMKIEIEAVKHRYGELCTVEAVLTRDLEGLDERAGQASAGWQKVQQTIEEKTEKVKAEFQTTATYTVTQLRDHLRTLAETLSTSMGLTELSKEFLGHAEGVLEKQRDALEQELEKEKRRLDEAGASKMDRGRCGIIKSQINRIKDIDLPRCSPATVRAMKTAQRVDGLLQMLRKATDYHPDLKAQLDRAIQGGRDEAKRYWASYEARYWSTGIEDLGIDYSEIALRQNPKTKELMDMVRQLMIQIAQMKEDVDDLTEKNKKLLADNYRRDAIAKHQETKEEIEARTRHDERIKAGQRLEDERAKWERQKRTDLAKKEEELRKAQAELLRTEDRELMEQTAAAANTQEPPLGNQDGTP